MYPRILQKFDNFLVSSIDKYANHRWYNNPLTKNILAGKEQYLQLWDKAKAEKYPLIDEFEKEYGYKIDENWYHQLALHTQIVIKKSKLVYVHGRLLYATLRKYIETQKPDNFNIIETGTARGFSALCMAKALADSNACGKIITYDVLPHNHKMYWNYIDDHEGKKTRAELLQEYKNLTGKFIWFHQGNTKTELPKLQTDRVHFAFLDSAHEYYYLMDEFLQIKDKQQKGDIVFFDDYTPKLFPGVVKAVDEICKKYNYSKRVITVSNERAYVIAEKL